MQRIWQATLLLFCLPGLGTAQELILPAIGPALKAQPLADKLAPPAPADTFPITLETALQLGNVQNPEIALARERINEALARQDRATALWLPDLELGTEWLRHDGQIQRFNGQVPTVSRSSLFVGGAATLSYDVSKLFFGPLAARQLTAATTAAAGAVTNQRLLDVAVAYMDLVQAYAELQIREEALANARQLVKITESHLAQGTGTAADSARARTEANIREREVLEAQATVRVVSARLTQLLNLPPGVTLVPVEPALVPLVLIKEDTPVRDLVAQGLRARPELAEIQAVGEAAYLRWREAKVGPWLPELRLGYLAGGFGGGPNSFFGNFNGRGDAAATATWRIDNLGAGNRAEQRERYCQHQQVLLRQTRLEAGVAEEIVSAHAVADVRRKELLPAQQAVQTAAESFSHNLKGVATAPKQYRPIELLQALQALARARLDYLGVIAGYNRSQFRLYAALGNPPLAALESATPLPTKEPVVPPK